MLSLMDRAFQPSTSIQDQTVYLTSVRCLQSIPTDEQQVSEKIKHLIAATKTRLQGFCLLEIALQQSPDIFYKGKWLVIIFKTLEDPSSSLMKELACKILCMAIKILAKHPAGYDEDIKKCKAFLFPFLLQTLENNCEWKEPALECLLTCLKYFGRDFDTLKNQLLNIIFINCTNTASSKTFELYAECFSVLPACIKNLSQESYQSAWSTQYITTLKTMIYTLNCLCFQPDDYETETFKDDVAVYAMDFIAADDDFSAHMIKVRQFVNLCKCLTKMLSTKTLFPVTVPIKTTLECVCRVFRVNDIKFNTSSVENQLFLSTITQLQITALELLEPLLLNFSMGKYKFTVCDLMISALRSSTVSAISNETISPIRHIVWKLLSVWLEVNSLSSFDIVQNPALIDELLKDISTEDVPAQASGHQSKGKSKKSTAANVGSKINFMNNTRYIVCLRALKALENLIYSAGTDISKEMFQDIFSKVVSAAHTILPQRNPPFPYDDERCRKNLYSVLLAIAIASKPDQREIFVCTVGILENALRDPSTKVSKLGQKANLISRLLLQPKKPLPLIKSLENRQKRPDMSSAIAKFSEWSSDDPYVPNIPPVESVSNVSENITAPRITQTFHNPTDSEISPNDFIAETHYPEAAAENQCNGEDMIELQNSSQCQEDVEESDEDEEEEEDEEDEMNQEMDIQTEHMYIPSTNEMQALNPVHINPETVHPSVSEQEYEELRPCAKSQGNVVDNSNKNQPNGARSIVPDEIQSASIQNVANANGIYASEDEEMEEEEGEEDEEEEEVNYPAEKKIPVFSESPAKMPKLENENEVTSEPQEEEMDQRSRSPTLVEMKADFCYSEVDDVKS